LVKSAQKKDGAAGENNGRRAFRKDSEAEEETEKDESKPGCSREDRRIFVAREAQDDGGADHGDREHRAKGHVGGGGVRKADHADGRWKQKQQPASRFPAVKTQRQPG